MQGLDSTKSPAPGSTGSQEQDSSRIAPQLSLGPSPPQWEDIRMQARNGAEPPLEVKLDKVSKKLPPPKAAAVRAVHEEALTASAEHTRAVQESAQTIPAPSAALSTPVPVDKQEQTSVGVQPVLGPGFVAQKQQAHAQPASEPAPQNHESEKLLPFGQETQTADGLTVTLPAETDVVLGPTGGEITINLLDANMANQEKYQVGAEGFSFNDLIASAQDGGPPPVVGPLLELHPHSSKFKEPIIIKFDLSLFLAELQEQVSQLRGEVAAMDLASLKKRAALELTADQQHALQDALAESSEAASKAAIVDLLVAASGEEDCTILMLRQSGTNKDDPWLPLEHEETLSVDANGMATVKLQSFSIGRICGKVGRKATSWAAGTVSKSVEGVCRSFDKTCGYVDTAAGKMVHKITNSVANCPAPVVNCIVKYILRQNESVLSPKSTR